MPLFWVTLTINFRPELRLLPTTLNLITYIAAVLHIWKCFVYMWFNYSEYTFAKLNWFMLIPIFSTLVSWIFHWYFCICFVCLTILYSFLGLEYVNIFNDVLYCVLCHCHGTARTRAHSAGPGQFTGAQVRIYFEIITLYAKFKIILPISYLLNIFIKFTLLNDWF